MGTELDPDLDLDSESKIWRLTKSESESGVLRAIYKSKLELKSYSSKILRVNCKFIYGSILTLTDKAQT